MHNRRGKEQRQQISQENEQLYLKLHKKTKNKKHIKNPMSQLYSESDFWDMNYPTSPKWLQYTKAGL